MKLDQVTGATQGVPTHGTSGDRMLARLTMATMLAATTAGCAVSPLTVAGPYPVVGNPVNPTPVHEYRVVCDTGLGLGILGYPSRTAHCTQDLGTSVVRHDVIRVRG